MARMIFWNVENFGINKILDPVNPLQAKTRLRYMRRVFTTNPPDIIVLVEVSAAAVWGMLDGIPIPPGGGQNGVTQLLTHLRNNLGPTWCLVPPLTLGDGGCREGVAVFFNSATLQFTGPYIYTNNDPLTGIPRGAVPGGGGAPANYPAPWYIAPGHANNVLPAAPVNMASPYNPGISQEQLAGQFMYFDAHGNEIFFPNGRGPGGLLGPPGSRSPFLTTFYDPAANKTIKLFAIHTSPATAVAAMQNVAQVQEVQNLAANELSVIAGDFNVDSFGAAMAPAGSYGRLIALGYTMQLNPTHIGFIAVNRRPYYMTHLLPVPAAGGDLRATPYDTSNPVGNDPVNTPLAAMGASPGGPYPSFGYMGTMTGLIFNQVSYAAAIDNVFTRYGGGTAVPPLNHRMTVINPVTGSPYNAVPPPGGTTTGFFVYPTQLHNPLPPGGAGVNRAADAPYRPDLLQFLQWTNYGVIRSTSDHLALILEV